MQCKIRVITGLLLLGMPPIIFIGYHVAEQPDVLRRSYIMKGKELYTRNQVKPLLGYREDLPKSVAKELRENLKLAKQTTKVILLWYKPWGEEYNPAVVDDDQCGKCKVVLDRSEISNPDTAIVVFHWVDVYPKTMPTPRRTNQLHVWWCSEPPTYVKYCQKKDLYYEDSYQFNATMNYRSDSDVWGPYWNAANLNRAANHYLNHSDVLKKKSKFALAMVSDCKIIPSAKDRLNLLQQFKLDKQVDLMGECFGYHRYKGTIDEYKFFFAFENSHHCRDYLTEKAFANSLLRGIVPVVWGATSKDYRRFMPKGSYILAEDYSSVEDLLEYMHFLDRNDDAYMSYFSWRLEDQNMDNNGIGRQNDYCALCRMAHGINVDDVLYSGRRNEEKEKLFTKSILPRTVPSLSQWFYGTENEECLRVY